MVGGVEKVGISSVVSLSAVWYRYCVRSMPFDIFLNVEVSSLGFTFIQRGFKGSILHAGLKAVIIPVFRPSDRAVRLEKAAVPPKDVSELSRSAVT
jgi:hypothetical protein